MILFLCILAYLAVGVGVARVARLWSVTSVVLSDDDPAFYGFVALFWPLVAAAGALGGTLWLLGRLAGVGVKR